MTDIIKPNDWGFWSKLLGKKVTNAKDFYSHLHSDSKSHSELAPYAVALVRTKSIIGYLLLAIFYKDGKAVRYLECTAKGWPYENEFWKKSLGQKYDDYQTELKRRQADTYSFPLLNLTFKVDNDWEKQSDGSYLQHNWHKCAIKVSEEQFIELFKLLTSPDEFGMKWRDLDWEDWGK